MHQHSIAQVFRPMARTSPMRAMAPMLSSKIQLQAESPTPMELAQAYGFERHRRISYCKLPE